MHCEILDAATHIIPASYILTLFLRANAPLAIDDRPGIFRHGPSWDKRFGVWRIGYTESTPINPGFLSVCITLSPAGFVEIVLNDHQGRTVAAYSLELPLLASMSLSPWARLAFEKIVASWGQEIAAHLRRVSEDTSCLTSVPAADYAVFPHRVTG